MKPRMRKLSMFLLTVAAMAVAAMPGVAGAQTPPPDTAIPAPSPIVIHLGKTPVVELFDGGAGLPYLGSATSYNAGDWENTLRAFHDTGVYANELTQIDKIAEKAVVRAVHKGDFRSHKARFHKAHGHRARAAHDNHGKKLALVLDIDETSLSNYDAINSDNFTFGPASQGEAVNETGKVIPSTLELFNLAKQNGVAVFFITGRRENTRTHTESNLTREGYAGWQQLFLKPDASTDTTVQYKSGARANIESQGYRIVANVGDQYSDLAGGHEDLGFKLANPFYFLP
jgi:putative acid phosphatase of HAD superfamily subfamily IIIB